MSLEATKHYPVMLDQILSIISPQHGGTFIDCTFGGGGYSKAILRYPNTKVFALDRDISTKACADDLKKKYPNRFSFFLNKFSNLNRIIKKNHKPKAIIFDLGISSFQLADQKRGFSFNSKNSLNMEMGLNERSAYDVVNTFDKKKLAFIIKTFGEEKYGKIIANKIYNYRKKKTINTAEELNLIIKDAKKGNKNFKRNPATKTFQAIRVFVNKELSELIHGLNAAAELLENDGIILVVSFHSIEDKIVKNFFNLNSNQNKNPSRYLPSNNSKASLFKLFLKKALIPSEKEISKNIRSRSAKLRYAIRNNSIFFNTKETKKRFEYYLKLENDKI